MLAHTYSLTTHWRVSGNREAVFAILADAEQYPRWWPAGFVTVQRHDATAARVLSKGFLPYRIAWIVRVQEWDAPRCLALRVEGDFAGTGRWTLEQDGEWVNVKFDWRIRTTRPLLRLLGWLARPLLVANHRWAMEQGGKSLAAELERRAKLAA